MGKIKGVVPLNESEVKTEPKKSLLQSKSDKDRQVVAGLPRALGAEGTAGRQSVDQKVDHVGVDAAWRDFGSLPASV